MLTHVIQIAGRVLLGLIFVVSGLGKVTNWSHSAAYMASKGFPWVPLFLACATAIEIICGLSLLLGYRFRQGAMILFFFLIPTTLIFHNFWGHAGHDHQMQMIQFLKNLSIMGGLLIVSTLPVQR